jgi:hypothetical protein
MFPIKADCYVVTAIITEMKTLKALEGVDKTEEYTEHTLSHSQLKGYIQ